MCSWESSYISIGPEMIKSYPILSLCEPLVRVRHHVKVSMIFPLNLFVGLDCDVFFLQELDVMFFVPPSLGQSSILTVIMLAC